MGRSCEVGASGGTPGGTAALVVAERKKRIVDGHLEDKLGQLHLNAATC